MKNAGALAPGFCQVAWVVRDIVAAERFFVETIGIERFLHIEHMRAQDVEGTYHGEPADWVCHLYLAYAGETQIELIQHVSGTSVFEEFLRDHGDAVQHVAYVIDDSEYESAARRLDAAGYPVLQGAKTPIAQIGYFDTRPAIGVATELIGVTEAGREFFRNLKARNF